MNSTLNRRAALAALSAGTVAAAIGPVAALAAPEPSAIRPEFLAAEQLFRRLEVESKLYDSTTAATARARFETAAAAVPHVALNVEGVEWSTASEAQVRTARHIVGIINCERPFRNIPEVCELRRLIAAHLRRERTVKRLPEALADRAAYHESERRTDELVAAEDAFFAMRPASLSELAHKLRVMVERQRDYEGCAAEILLPDVLAIATRGAER